MDQFCKNCNTILNGKYQKIFCSKQCSSFYYKKTLTPKQCPNCQKLLYTRWDAHVIKCNKVKKVTKNIKISKSYIDCKYCNIKFKRKRPSHKFCTSECYIKWRSLNPIHRTIAEKTNLRHHIMARYENGWLPKSGRCRKIKYYSPIAGNITVDGTWELLCAKYFDFMKWNWKRNKKRFKYLNLDNKISYYTPDFYVEELDSFIEVKGYETDLDRCKWSQFSERLTVWKLDKIKEIKKFFRKTTNGE